MRKLLLTLCLTASLAPAQSWAKNISLDIGRSDVFTTKEKIDTIFVSNPGIADYKILDDNKFILYAKNEGRSDITVLDADGKVLVSDALFVTMGANYSENSIAGANQAMKMRFPNSQLKVKKVGKAYVIEGVAQSDQEREEAERIIGAAFGLSPKITDKSVGKQNSAFLTSYSYEHIINNAIVEQATQINVKLTVVEVNKNIAEELGIQWEHFGGAFLKNLGSPFRNLNSGYFGVTGGFNGHGGSMEIGAGNGAGSGNIKGFINALHDNSKGKVLAEPNVSMLSGEVSEVLIGGQVPLMQTDNDGNPTVEYKDFGIKLEVGAKVQKNNRIRVALEQEVSSLGESIGSTKISMPLLNTRSSSSTLELADGESFIIGGLYNSKESEGLSKVPWLGDIPILGAFFRSTSNSKMEKELVIVATVHLVKPVQESDIVYPNFETTGTLERFFNTKPITDTATTIYHKTLISNFLQRGGFIQ